MIFLAVLTAAFIVAIIVLNVKWKKEYGEMEADVLNRLGLSDWDGLDYYDAFVAVKSRSSVEKYDEVKFFKEHPEYLAVMESAIAKKQRIADAITDFLNGNEYQSRQPYSRLKRKLDILFSNAKACRLLVKYTSPTGKSTATKEILLSQQDIARFKKDPSLLMGKGEYNKYLKEQQKEALSQKQHDFYDQINCIIDCASQNRDSLVIQGSQEQLDQWIAELFDRTVNSIKKIKSTDSEEWDMIQSFITHVKEEVEKIVRKNQQILDYYQSSEFQKIKDTCEALMGSQREFNDYIREKVQSISKLFGTRVVRNETVHNDEYAYIRPYKKTITPFTAEVSAAVFASAENAPLDYVVKNFYPNKSQYPEQIQKLQLLLEELETLKDAKQIIENYKAEYQQYLDNVPTFILEHDEAGFYSRLGFANIDESVLTVEYKFSYTSSGGMAQRSFTVPMTEETITELINALAGKLTASAFAKEQRNLMTRKLREHIKQRDNYTCCSCGNSTAAEPNLLLEIDHIIPVAKGGCTVEENLQTLCWKCNRAKSDKILSPASGN